MREVPAYKIIFEKSPQHPYLLVIPVINEGERISILLDRIELIKEKEFDVLIVDGGSTDGSLDKVRDQGVDTLLLKTGPGKLSAQLRCAYAYGLDKGYKGIVTIDGNNKDDPEAIPSFIGKLKEGYDFVQASRFLPGGKQVNTPRIREVAIKLIHAPLLSIFSGFHWTDTTQGFRAYSRKMLESEEIDIFRDVFSNYELLAYLSYIAPKKEFKCVEIPTSRVYPEGEAPTEISFLRGNFEVLLTLFKTIAGTYNKKK